MLKEIEETIGFVIIGRIPIGAGCLPPATTMAYSLLLISITGIILLYYCNFFYHVKVLCSNTFIMMCSIDHYLAFLYFYAALYFNYEFLQGDQRQARNQDFVKGRGLEQKLKIFLSENCLILAAC